MGDDVKWTVQRRTQHEPPSIVDEQGRLIAEVAQGGRVTPAEATRYANLIVRAARHAAELEPPSWPCCTHGCDECEGTKPGSWGLTPADTDLP